MPINHLGENGQSIALSKGYESSPSGKTVAGKAAQSEHGPVIVDLKGAVKHPGLYHAKADERLYDVLKKAGGLLPGADESKVNFAQKLQDQAMIYIPLKGETPTPSAPAGSSATGSATGSAAGPAPKINLNTATAEELQQIDGVGEKKAEKIIAFRDSQGPFQSVADLDKVDGFGAKTVARFQEKVTV